MKPLNLQQFDALEAVRLRQEFSGELPLAALSRFTDGLPAQHGTVAWHAQGMEGRFGERLLRVHVRAQPLVVCQRCLEEFAWPIDSVAVLQLVDSEDELGEYDPLDDEELEQGYDKVVGSHQFDLQAEIESELILALPYIPRHEVCPGKGSAPDSEPPVNPDRQRPFEQLAELLGRGAKK